MARAVFTVAQAGPHVSVQDRGRPGLMRFGAPRSGPMDRIAFASANAALGNTKDAPGVEVSLGGLVLDCIEGALTVAVAGGGFQVALDEEPSGAWTVLTVRAGSRLAVRPGHWGSWTYLAFAGRLQARAWLGSVSTHEPSGLGGGCLAPGQGLVVDDAQVRADRVGPFPCPVSARPRHAVRVVLGPQDRFFDAGAVQALLSQPFALTHAYDRMGVRLAGPSLPVCGALDMPSEPVVRGAIQVGGDGVASVLLADALTTGGYPKIAAIVSTDLDGFVQLRGRDLVAFRRVTPAEAVAATRTERLARDRFLVLLERDEFGLNR